MGIKEVNPLDKNLFKTELKAVSSFRRGGAWKKIHADQKGKITLINPWRNKKI